MLLLEGLSYTTLFLIIAAAAKYLRRYLWDSLHELPGPFLGRLSSLYRVWLMWSGHGPVKIQNLHKRYGPIVRVGPRHVYVSDPVMLPVIYGTTAKFGKASITSVLLMSLRRYKYMLMCSVVRVL
jgi:hypothetical protein